MPAYGGLWLAGRLFAGWQRDNLRSLAVLALSLVGAACVAYLISGGAFYSCSGRYPEPTLAGFLVRIAQYVPRHLGNLAFYVGTALVLHAGIFSALRLRAREVH